MVHALDAQGRSIVVDIGGMPSKHVKLFGSAMLVAHPDVPTFFRHSLRLHEYLAGTGYMSPQEIEGHARYIITLGEMVNENKFLSEQDLIDYAEFDQMMRGHQFKDNISWTRDHNRVNEIKWNIFYQTMTESIARRKPGQPGQPKDRAAKDKVPREQAAEGGAAVHPDKTAKKTLTRPPFHADYRRQVDCPTFFYQGPGKCDYHPCKFQHSCSVAGCESPADHGTAQHA